MGIFSLTILYSLVGAYFYKYSSIITTEYLSYKKLSLLVGVLWPFVAVYYLGRYIIEKMPLYAKAPTPPIIKNRVNVTKKIRVEIPLQEELYEDDYEKELIAKFDALEKEEKVKQKHMLQFAKIVDDAIFEKKVIRQPKLLNVPMVKRPFIGKRRTW